MSRSAGAAGSTVVIVGAGGHGAVVADILQRAHESGGGAVPIGFVDDTPELQGAAVLGLKVLGPIATLSSIPHEMIVVAIGDNAARRSVSDTLAASGERLATAIHPSAVVAPSARIGEGVVICPGAIVGVRAGIGRGVILNTRASVDHDSVVADFAHVSAAGTVGARAFVGAETLIAIGGMVVSDQRVGERSLIGAGAVVVDAIPDDVVAFGVPARVRYGRISRDRAATR